ncbi:MAG: ABC transporter permease subunit, partial [Akkermansiaceae bacterium]
ELYAIAAAVLGGCSLRGGEGTIVGVVIGTAVMQLLKNMINLVDWLKSHMEFLIVGIVLLVAVIADEMIKQRVRKLK